MLPHCGGALAFLKGRIAMFFDHPSAPRPPALRGYALTMSQQRQYGLEPIFEARFRRFYADTAGAGGWPHAVRMARDVFGVEAQNARRLLKR